MTGKTEWVLTSALALALSAGASGAVARVTEHAVQQVSFPSADGHTQLVGYLYIPDRASGRAPGIVLMHGRSGAYTKGADGDYSAKTLRKRDETWARFWRARGYEVLIVDSFGPRGYPAGFAAGTHDERPASVDEVTVRPFDAYGALSFLQARPEVAGDRVGLMGWSNGASATLASVATNGVASAGRSVANGFRVALAFYPGCGLNGAFDGGYKPYAFVKVFIGSADEEVSPEECRRLATKNAEIGGGVDLTVYPGATHDFDDPLNHRQDTPANVTAKADATTVAAAFFDANLRP
jgi:carboxymethylenebutenolidase